MTTESTPRRRLVIGNWKMHGSLADNAMLLAGLRAGAGDAPDCELAVCAPFPYLAQARSELEGSGVAWGAQDVSVHAQGAYTGEVSAAMLGDFAFGWVLTGHSARRGMPGDTDEMVAATARVERFAGITPGGWWVHALPLRETGPTNTGNTRHIIHIAA